MVLPIRVVTTGSAADPGDAATAVEVAVSAGASVIAMGGSVNPDDPAVAQAVAAALAHDVVVVAGGELPSGGPGGGPSTGVHPAGLVRVGAVGEDRQPAAAYRPGGVDVLAPGIDVASLGLARTGVRAGSGVHYAVAFVAATAALVRAAHPSLSAAAVVDRISSTSHRWAEHVPDPATGWGMIDPVAAVITPLSDEESAAGAGPLSPLTLILILATVCLAAGVGLAVALPWRRARARSR
jgi:hypothetical protein